jgi:hypothetical protein
LPRTAIVERLARRLAVVEALIAPFPALAQLLL